ncbi:MAG: DUF2207 domain-containing protein, partial [Acidimicrobiia bacterium]|nr:DUF2207 domain-containing protein [Acidimicrobiia bacterium]
MRSLLRLVIVGVLVFGPATAAGAKSFWLSEATVDVVVNPDGSLDITESLTFDFSGSFSGAYRDIPLDPGESITEIEVRGEELSYLPGACTELGCTSPPGTFGVARFKGFVRIVWHHSSTDEARVFHISYRFSGLAVAYDDVVDVNLQVWGDQWAVGLDRLEARMHLPGSPAQGEVLVWGHPFGVEGSISLGDGGVSPFLQASGISPEQWVEMRVVFPRRILEAVSGATVAGGAGLPVILDEETAFAGDAEEAARATRVGLAWGVAIAISIVLGLGGLTYFRFGREPRIEYDREYEQEPPSDLSPAEVGALLSQGAVTEREFTATLFDLIRKGAIDASPSQVERETWGGLRSETITDLVLSEGEKEMGLRDFEQSVMTVVKRVLDEDARPLHEFKKGIREDAAANAETYQVFRRKAKGAVERAGLLDTSGNTAILLGGIALVAVLAGAFFLLPRLLRTQPGGATLAALVIGGMVLGALILFGVLAFRRVRVRRTKTGALEAARWAAFKRYLADFSRLEEAPVISLDLWDRFLVYAIAFGVAEEVLEHARLQAPPDLETNSS